MVEIYDLIEPFCLAGHLSVDNKLTKSTMVSKRADRMSMPARMTRSSSGNRASPLRIDTGEQSALPGIDTMPDADAFLQDF